MLKINNYLCKYIANQGLELQTISIQCTINKYFITQVYSTLNNCYVVMCTTEGRANNASSANPPSHLTPCTKIPPQFSDKGYFCLLR